VQCKSVAHLSSKSEQSTTDHGIQWPPRFCLCWVNACSPRELYCALA
jgi:hypothetical protein